VEFEGFCHGEGMDPESSPWFQVSSFAMVKKPPDRDDSEPDMTGGNNDPSRSIAVLVGLGCQDLARLA